MQLSTASFGVFGACFALCAHSPEGAGETGWSPHLLHPAPLTADPNSLPPTFAEDATAWILPFTAGGFLYIALVNVVPDLLEESSLRYLFMFRTPSETAKVLVELHAPFVAI